MGRENCIALLCGRWDIAYTVYDALLTRCLASRSYLPDLTPIEGFENAELARVSQMAAFAPVDNSEILAVAKLDFEDLAAMDSDACNVPAGAEVGEVGAAA